MGGNEILVFRPRKVGEAAVLYAGGWVEGFVAEENTPHFARVPAAAGAMPVEGGGGAGGRWGLRERGVCGVCCCWLCGMEEEVAYAGYDKRGCAARKAKGKKQAKQRLVGGMG